MLEAIYAAFAEGWADPAGTETRRRDLAGEAVWLGRLVVSLMPDEAEALGLLALMLFAEARRGARRSADGDFVPLSEQDTALWDDAAIDEAERLLSRANRLEGSGRYQIEAALQSAHCARRHTGRTDWPAIAALYAALSAIAYSPVVEINRAVAIAECGRTTVAMAMLDRLSADRRLWPTTSLTGQRAAKSFARLGRTASAVDAYRQAIGLERDPAVRRFLQARLDEVEVKKSN